MTEKYLITIDFDGTAFNTFEKSPNGIGVIEAYNNAILNVFGEPGKEIYENRLGGLDNRSPSKLVDLILENDSPEEILRENAKDFFDQHRLRLLKLLPESKQGEFNWKDSEINKIITELVILEKLSHLSNEIGKELPSGEIWPRACKGFEIFYQEIKKINETNDINIDLAIVSSGHDNFIEKTFKAHKLTPPKIIISDDTIRPKKYPALEKRVKPAPYPFGLAHREWLKQQDIKSSHPREQIIYFGDDPKKDGGLATNCGIIFGLFDPESKHGQETNENRFSFSDWKQIAQILEENQQLLSKGAPFSDIFSMQRKSYANS